MTSAISILITCHWQTDRLWHLPFVQLLCALESSLNHGLIDWLSMVLRLRQHNIGYTADGFYRSDDPTNQPWDRMTSGQYSLLRFMTGSTMYKLPSNSATNICVLVFQHLLQTVMHQSVAHLNKHHITGYMLYKQTIYLLLTHMTSG